MTDPTRIDDLIEDLRNHHSCDCSCVGCAPSKAAADEIERLRAEPPPFEDGDDSWIDGAHPDVLRSKLRAVIHERDKAIHQRQQARKSRDLALSQRVDPGQPADNPEPQEVADDLRAKGRPLLADMIEAASSSVPSFEDIAEAIANAHAAQFLSHDSSAARPWAHWSPSQCDRFTAAVGEVIGPLLAEKEKEIERLRGEPAAWYGPPTIPVPVWWCRTHKRARMCVRGTPGCDFVQLRAPVVSDD